MAREELTSLRLDKWLWTMRFFKTRSQATDSCDRSRVSVNGAIAKASREVKAGDTIAVDNRLFIKTVKIIRLNKERVGPKLVSEFIEDLTPAEEYRKKDQEQLNRQPMYRIEDKPSKKSRRALEDFLKRL